jgi:uncharacterized damage-inducible protein DinB
MAIHDQILFMLNMVASTTEPLINDITEEESMSRGVHQFNHIRWQTGHLIHTDYQMLSLLGGDQTAPAEYKKLFDYKTELSDDPDFYPPMAELRQALIDVEKALEEAAAKADDAVYAGEVDWADGPIPVSHMISFLCMHNFYHCGQITHIRKMFGRPRPFV